jgi:hypothetical protein
MHGGKRRTGMLLHATVTFTSADDLPGAPGVVTFQALFGTRVLVGISGDNPLEYWVKPLPAPNPHKTPPTIH